MFESIINRAQHSVESVVTKYALRAAVTVPFLIAFGFGTAAATVKLVQMYGHTQAYSIIAAAFAVIGLIAAASIAATSPRSATAAAVETQEAVGSESGAYRRYRCCSVLRCGIGPWSWRLSAWHTSSCRRSNLQLQKLRSPDAFTHFLISPPNYLLNHDPIW